MWRTQQFSGGVVTGGIVTVKDSNWLLSWTFNRQPQFRSQPKDQLVGWIYGLFTDKPGNYVKKAMRDCTGKEICMEWLYHIGVPKDAVNFAFLGQFAETKRDTIFTTEYSMRTGMEAVYTLLNVDRGVPEVWGSTYDVRDLLNATIQLRDGHPLTEMKLGLKEKMAVKKVLETIRGTDVEKILKEYHVIE